MINLTSSQLRRAADLQDKIVSLQKELNRLLGSAHGAPAPRKRRKMSAAGKARIRAAQKTRWAKIKGKKTRRKPGRTLTAVAKAAISARMKAMWAARKAARKK